MKYSPKQEAFKVFVICTVTVMVMTYGRKYVKSRIKNLNGCYDRVTTNIIETRQLYLVDKDGNHRGALAVLDTGEVRLELGSPSNDDSNMILSVRKDGSVDMRLSRDMTYDSGNNSKSSLSLGIGPEIANNGVCRGLGVSSWTNSSALYTRVYSSLSLGPTDGGRTQILMLDTKSKERVWADQAITE